MRYTEQAYTLLELLIALALALFLSAGIVRVFMHCKKTYAATQHLHTTQTNARVAFNWLSRDVRMAGFIGCVRLVDCLPLQGRFMTDTGIAVWHKGDTMAGLSPSLLMHLSRARRHSDILLIQALNPNTVPVQFAQGQQVTLVWRPSFRLNDHLLISDCQHAEVLRWGSAHLKYTYQSDSEIGFLDKILYYVGDTGRRTSQGRPIYALYRRNINKSANNPIELVEDVEKISVRVGVRLAANNGIIYRLPDRITRGVDVRSLEITLSLHNKQLLQHEWKQIVALRQREAYAVQSIH